MRTTYPSPTLSANLLEGKYGRVNSVWAPRCDCADIGRQLRKTRNGPVEGQGFCGVTYNASVQNLVGAVSARRRTGLGVHLLIYRESRGPITDLDECTGRAREIPGIYPQALHCKANMNG